MIGDKGILVPSTDYDRRKWKKAYKKSLLRHKKSVSEARGEHKSDLEGLAGSFIRPSIRYWFNILQ